MIDIDVDPTKPEVQGAAGGAGDDDDISDWKLVPPSPPPEPPDPPKSMWEKEGARPKNPYVYQKVPQEDIHLKTFPPEKKGIPSTSKRTAETSFIERNTSGHVFTAAEKLGTMEVRQHFPDMDHSKVEVRYIAQERGGLGKHFEVKMRNKTTGKWYSLFLQKRDENGEYVLRKDLTKEIKEALGSYKTKTELVQQKDREIQQKAQQCEELNKTIEEDRRIADDENEQPSVRDRACERVTENTKREAKLGQEQNQLEQEREQIAERLPLQEQLKDLFKKHGFTLATVVTAVGIRIGVVAKILADGASAAANGIKTVGKKVGDGLKE